MTDPTPDRCATCAFRPGTVAARNGLTRALARLSLLLGEPFYCHEGVADGDEPTVLCAGWRAAHAERYHAGYYRMLPAWRRAVLNGCMETVQLYIRSIHDGQPLPDEAAAELLWAAIEREHALSDA